MSLTMQMAKSATFLPMVVATGLGIGGGIAFGIHYLKNNQEVVLRKRSNPYPWNKVAPNENTKLISFNPKFWKSRSKADDPRLDFIQIKPDEFSDVLHRKENLEVMKS